MSCRRCAFYRFNRIAVIVKRDENERVTKGAFSMWALRCCQTSGRNSITLSDIEEVFEVFRWFRWSSKHLIKFLSRRVHFSIEFRFECSITNSVRTCAKKNTREMFELHDILLYLFMFNLQCDSGTLSTHSKTYQISFDHQSFQAKQFFLSHFSFYFFLFFPNHSSFWFLFISCNFISIVLRAHKSQKNRNRLSRSVFRAPNEKCKQKKNILLRSNVSTLQHEANEVFRSFFSCDFRVQKFTWQWTRFAEQEMKPFHDDELTKCSEWKSIEAQKRTKKTLKYFNCDIVKRKTMKTSKQ